MKYYRCDKILEKGCQMNMILSSKGIGKSYSVKELLLVDFLKNGKEFIFSRRFRRQTSPSKVARQFADIDIMKVVKTNKIPSNAKVVLLNSYDYLKIDAWNGDIFIKGLKQGRWEKIYTCGYYLSLDTSFDDFSGAQFPNVASWMIEEFDRPPYAEDEIKHFCHLSSSVFREREGRIFFLGNLDSKFCPYFDYFDIWDIINNIKQNEIVTTVVKADDNDMTLAIERANNHGMKNKMVAGNHFRKMIASGEWEEGEYTIGFGFGETIYTVLIDFDKVKFRACLKVGKKSGKLNVFIHPVTHLDTKKITYDKKLTAEIEDCYNSSCIWDVNNGCENEIRKMIEGNYNVFFGTSLIGTDFYNAYNSYMKGGVMRNVI